MRTAELRENPHGQHRPMWHPRKAGLFQEGEEFGGGGGFAEAGKDVLDGVIVGGRVAVGHGVSDEDDVIAEVVSAAGRGFDTGGGGNAGEENLSDTEIAEVFIEARADKCADSLFGDEVVGGLLVEFRSELGPVGREIKFGTHGFDAAGSHAGDVDEDDGIHACAEGTGEVCGAGYNIGGGVDGGHGDDALLEVDGDEGGGGVELAKRHVGFFLFGVGDWTSALARVFLLELDAKHEADRDDAGKAGEERRDVIGGHVSGEEEQISDDEIEERP